MRDDFELAILAATLLPVCFYSKNRTRSSDEVSNVTSRGTSQSQTGVDLRWLTPRNMQSWRRLRYRNYTNGSSPRMES